MIVGERVRRQPARGGHPWAAFVGGLGRG
jgi:hypothetical protein